MTTAEALKQAPKTDPALAPLDKTYQTAAAGLKKSPKSAKAKKTYVDAALAYAQACMADRAKLPPPVQYRSALALYRGVLVVDPHNAESLSQKKTIEGVYKQMGMPIPK
jgi:hypothetical protein